MMKYYGSIQFSNKLKKAVYCHPLKNQGPAKCKNSLFTNMQHLVPWDMHNYKHKILQRCCSTMWRHRNIIFNCYGCCGAEENYNMPVGFVQWSDVLEKELYVGGQVSWAKVKSVQRSIEKSTRSYGKVCQFVVKLFLPLQPWHTYACLGCITAAGYLQAEYLLSLHSWYCSLSCCHQQRSWRSASPDQESLWSWVRCFIVCWLPQLGSESAAGLLRNTKAWGWDTHLRSPADAPPYGCHQGNMLLIVKLYWVCTRTWYLIFSCIF